MGNVRDGRPLGFWQSKSFYTLHNVGGKLVERSAGEVKPKDAEFVRGGRRAAVEKARELWPGAKSEAPAAKSAVAVAEKPAGDEAVQGEKPDLGKPLVDEKPAMVSEKPRRVPRVFKGLRGGGFPRISEPAMGKHGLPR